MSSSTNISLENSILCCILDNPNLLKELFIDDKCFLDPTNNKMIKFLKKVYAKDNTLDLNLIVSKFNDDTSKNKFLNFYSDLISDTFCLVSNFYKYQEELQEFYRNKSLDSTIKNYEDNLITREELIDKIKEIEKENLYVTQKVNRKTPQEMLDIIRNDERTIVFNDMKSFNSMIKISEKTVNIIAARPSEGKSALALNLLCDLSKTYKCIYFNMEMTEAEVYERMLGIVSNIPIADIRKPQTDYQDNLINQKANEIYNYNYEVINGSKSLSSLKAKIIREQREEHLIVFIDYVGYVTTKYGMSDKDRIGEITRELNNITKDYDCTVFLIAQINRNGAEQPTMKDIKDSKLFNYFILLYF